MEDRDLRDVGITDPGHRKKILHAARSLPKVLNIPTFTRAPREHSGRVSEEKDQNVMLVKE